MSVRLYANMTEPNVTQELTPNNRVAKLSVRLDEDTYEKLRRIAFDERTSFQAILVEGVMLYLKRSAGPARKAKKA